MAQAAWKIVLAIGHIRYYSHNCANHNQPKGTIPRNGTGGIGIQKYRDNAAASNRADLRHR